LKQYKTGWTNKANVYPVNQAYNIIIME